MASDTPIVITGGSVTIDFDPAPFSKNGNKFHTKDRRIKRIEITGTGVGNTVIDIDQLVADGDATIKIYLGKP